MAWKLGLDLGTNSIGWTVFITDRPEPDWSEWSLADAGVRIIPDGREPAGNGRVGASLAVARRTARGMRRNRDHGINRIRGLVSLLIGLELLPSADEDRKTLIEKSPYDLRDQAVAGGGSPMRVLSPHELGRVLLHLGLRRGFKSNRKTDSGDEKITEFGERIGQLHRALQFHAIDKATLDRLGEDAVPSGIPWTLGQFLAARLRVGLPVRFRGEEGDFYPDRAMFADEFERIRAAQSPYHTLTEADWSALRDRYILFQHPLRPVERGACSIYPDQPRAHRDTPIAQRFRIFKEVANLRWLDASLTDHPLTQTQHRAITQRLLQQKSASFSSFRGLKGEDGRPLFSKDSRFNLEDERRTGLDGDRIGAMMRNHPALALLWKGRDAAWLDDLFEFLHTPLCDGHLLDDAGLTLALTREFAVSVEQARVLAALPLSSITASLSRKAMEDLLPLMEDQGLDEYLACVELLGEHDAKKRLSGFQSEPERFPELPYYGQILSGSVLGADPRKPAGTDPEGHFGRIGNPTVHIALNQVRKLVNELIRRFGEPPASIHVELSRDLKLPRKKREEINATIRDNESANKKRAEKWRDLSKGQEPSPADIKKIKLWEELGRDELSRRCVFTGRVIAAHHLINGEVEIEHLLPRSRTLDDGLGNLTLSFRDANRLKGNQTPFEAFGHDQHAERGMAWKDILDRASRLPPNKRRKFSATAMNDWEVETDFIARQMTDNAHIARAARRYLTAVCDDVMPSPGRLTALIRGQWGLNGLLSDDNKKNRTDHRHHAIDAFVIGLANRSLLQRVSTARGTDDRVRVNIPELPEVLRNALRDRLETLVVSFKPDHGGQGGMFNETAYGFVKDPEDPDLPGYNLVTRKKLPMLSDKELRAIRDQAWRSAIADFLRESGYGELSEVQKKKKLPELLSAFGKTHGIKSIRIRVKNDSVCPVPSAPYKGYAKGEYACCDIWALPAGKKGRWKKGETVWQGTFWSYADCRDGQVPPPPERKPHPAAKFIMRLFKNDMVALDDGGQTRIMRVGGYATMVNKLDLKPFRDADPPQKHISINTLGKINLRKVGVSVSGQVRDPKARRS